MKTTHRSYSEESGDFGRLCHFIMGNHDHVRDCSTWSLGRLVDWKYGLYDAKTAVAAFCDRNAHLWFDGFGDLAGFAVSENGGGECAIIASEGYRWLFENMLGWVLAEWGGRPPCLSIEITERQVAEAAVLRRFGFRQSQTFSARRFDLNAQPLPRIPLEDGFTIVDMATHPDYRAQRILRANGFGGKAGLTEEDLAHQLEFYNHSHDGPIYHPQCDLCVMAQDGRFVAGCEALIDARNLTADIERICTHSDFRRRGFARAVIQECLIRVRDIGMRRAYITGYSPAALALYGSLGHVGEQQCYIYELPRQRAA